MRIISFMCVLFLSFFCLADGFLKQNTRITTVDSEINKLIRNGFIKQFIDHISTDCDSDKPVKIVSTTDGVINLEIDKPVDFLIRKSDDFTRFGGWYWICDGISMKTEIRNATLIQAERNGEGSINWYSFKIIKDEP